jgi:hypothetical protein
LDAKFEEDYNKVMRDMLDWKFKLFEEKKPLPCRALEKPFGGDPSYRTIFHCSLFGF